VPHFQLRTADGDELGAVHLGRPDWPPGSVIYRGGDQPDLRVVDVIVLDDPEVFDVLVVSPWARWGDQYQTPPDFTANAGPAADAAETPTIAESRRTSKRRTRFTHVP
jgi:hypothetical protein